MSAANEGAVKRQIARGLLGCMAAAVCAMLSVGCGPAEPPLRPAPTTPAAAPQSNAAPPEPQPEMAASEVAAEPPLSLVKLQADNRYVTSAACQHCHTELRRKKAATAMVATMILVLALIAIIVIQAMIFLPSGSFLF